MSRSLFQHRAARRRLALSLSLLAALLGVFAVRAHTHAQDRFDAETFEQAGALPDSILTTYSGRTLERGQFALALTGSYARKPLGVTTKSGTDLGELAGSLSTLQLTGTVGISSWFDLGLALPVHRVSRGSDFGGSPGPSLANAVVTESKFGLGMVRVIPRVSLLRTAGDGVNLAFLVPVGLPTGDKDLYVSESYRIEPRLALDARKRRNLFAANVGYLIRPRAKLIDTTVDDQVTWRAGAQLPLSGKESFPLFALAELYGQMNVLSGHLRREDFPFEALAGLRFRNDSFLAQLAGGPGVIRGPSAPAYRLLATVAFLGAKREHDHDHDGILDAQDRCPNAPEDRDGFEDHNGCPDPDNDRDQVEDAKDKCPNDPEDADGFQDDDGCADPDNDGDQVLDLNDRCPLEPEDMDGEADSDGCPDADAPVVNDDTDGDGVKNAVDRCPDVAGSAEFEGCPPPPPKVEVKKDTIDLNEPVFFEMGSAEIQARSSALLDAIAEALAINPDLARVRVEGHTDDTGYRESNLKLSRARAKAVVAALIKRGVDKSRLKSRGLGQRVPLVPNDSDENRSRNRRVELHIEQRTQGGAAAPPDAGAGQPAP
jgi:outer membrane protein OmpA-like peptidoglycan-associated protein